MIYVVNSLFPKFNYAKKIANLALKKKLAACVNINDKVKSLFWWEKKILEETEVELSFKTISGKVQKLINFIEEHHPYECPCVISFKVDKANKKYLNWVFEETSK